MKKKNNFVASENSSCYTNETRHLDPSVLSISSSKLTQLLTYLHTCILTTILNIYLLAYSLEYLLPT